MYEHEQPFPLTMLVSMGLVFYLSHPLGHFFVAWAYGVGTDYFFVGRSDFRKLRLKPMSVVGGLMPTIGTKLKKDGLAKLPPRKTRTRTTTDRAVRPFNGIRRLLALPCFTPKADPSQ